MTKTHFQLQADSAQDRIDQHRESLHYASTEEHVERLKNIVDQIAFAEEAHRLYISADAWLTRAGKDGLIDWATSELIRSVDDTWSGRSNDFRRGIHDSRLETLRAIMSHAKYALTNEADRGMVTA